MAFKRLDQEDISISAESVVTPLWSTDQVKLTTFFTSSTQAAGSTGDFYYKVYNTNVNVNASAVPQFAVTFGNKNGGGALRYTTAISGSPSSTIYGQYRSLVYGDEEKAFTFQNQVSDSIYVISVDRARYKEKLLPGSFNLILSGSGGRELRLTDNSKTISTLSYLDAGRVYDIISGSNGAPYSGTGLNTQSGSYGKFLPDVGLIILNSTALDAAGDGIALGTVVTQDTAGDNISKIYNAINRGGSFELQSEETVTSNFIFVRVRNSEFNYSTNPSNITGSGELKYDIMINTPQAYVTTVGLYNDNNDLLGVAKLSRPLLKDFTKEALIRIKLDY